MLFARQSINEKRNGNLNYGDYRFFLYIIEKYAYES